MKVCIRAHDLGVAGTEQILERLNSLGLDGVQMVCYKAYPDIAQAPGAMTRERRSRSERHFLMPGRASLWWALTSIPFMRMRGRWRRAC